MFKGQVVIAEGLPGSNNFALGFAQQGTQAPGRGVTGFVIQRQKMADVFPQCLAATLDLDSRFRLGGHRQAPPERGEQRDRQQ